MPTRKALGPSKCHVPGKADTRLTALPTYGTRRRRKHKLRSSSPPHPPPATHSTSGAPVSPVRSTKFPYAHTMGGQGPVPGALHTKLCVYQFACLRKVGRLSLPPTISDHRNPAVEPTLFSLYQAVCCTSPWGWQCFNLHLKMLVKG